MICAIHIYIALYSFSLQFISSVMQNNSNTLSVFVDDGDAGIQYRCIYTEQLSGPTDPGSFFSSLGSSHDPRTPWYGTLSTCPGKKSRISYVFNGTAFTALFVNGDKHSLRSCTIDSSEQTITDTLSGPICTNSSPLSSRPHNLTIIFNGTTPAQFDGLIYTPTAPYFPDSGVDIVFQGNVPGGAPGRLWVNYTTHDAVISSLGDGLSVEFNGRSLAIYSHIIFSSPNSTFFQYTVDNEAPITFEIPSPLTNSSSSRAIFDKQLILNTPPTVPGLHQLRMSIISAPNSTSETNLFSIQNIIDQTLATSISKVSRNSPNIPSNATTTIQQTSVMLSSFTPPPSSTGMPIQAQRSSKISHNTIIAIAVPISISLFLLLLLVTWVQRRRANRRKAAPPHMTHMEAISPFIVPPTVQSGRSLGWLPLRVLREKGSRNCEDLGLLPRTVKSDRSASRHQDRPLTVRSEVHPQEVVESNDEVEEQEEIVNLPPVYNDIQTQRNPVPPTNLIGP